MRYATLMRQLLAEHTAIVLCSALTAHKLQCAHCTRKHTQTNTQHTNAQTNVRLRTPGLAAASVNASLARFWAVVQSPVSSERQQVGVYA